MRAKPSMSTPSTLPTERAISIDPCSSSVTSHARKRGKPTRSSCECKRGARAGRAWSSDYERIEQETRATIRLSLQCKLTLTHSTCSVEITTASSSGMAALPSLTRSSANTRTHPSPVSRSSDVGQYSRSSFNVAKDGCMIREAIARSSWGRTYLAEEGCVPYTQRLVVLLAGDDAEECAEVRRCYSINLADDGRNRQRSKLQFSQWAYHSTLHRGPHETLSTA